MDHHTGKGASRVLDMDLAQELADRMLAAVHGEPGPEVFAAALDVVGNIIAYWSCPGCRRRAAKLASKSLPLILVDALKHAEQCDRAEAERATSRVH
jgi:hypothetical protein